MASSSSILFKSFTSSLYQPLHPCNQKTVFASDFYARCCKKSSPASKTSKDYLRLTHRPLQMDQVKFFYCSTSRSKKALIAPKPHSHIFTRQVSHSSDEPKLSLKQKLQTMYKDYCFILLPVHVITSAAWLGGFFYMVSSGFDIGSFLESLNVNKKLITPFRGGNASTTFVHDLAISCALFNLTVPLRYSVTLGLTNVCVKYLKKRGYLDHGFNKEQLKQYIKEKKEAIMRKDMQ